MTEFTCTEMVVS